MAFTVRSFFVDFVDRPFSIKYAIETTRTSRKANAKHFL
jgi:hypothetical protein